MAEKQKNQIIVIEPVTKTVNELLEMIMERDQADISPFKNADEAVQFARQFVPCMLVICIQTNNDIPNVLNTLKKLKPDIKQGFVKTLLVSKVKNPQLQKLIGEFGVTDYIEEPIPARTLQFKANLQLKAVDTTRKQLEQKKLSEEKIVFKTTKKGEEETQSTGGDVKARQKPALQLANDTFLIKNSAIKKQGKKYTVELDGPDPSTGEWVSDGEKEGNPNWRWKPNDKEDEPGSEEGDGWVCSGEKPQYKPATKKWQLSSEKPALFFKKKNQKIAEKIGTDANGEIEVAEDSPAAEENLRKNLAKSQRLKKRKQAEAAGLPIPEEEEEAPPAPKVEAAEKEEEDEDSESADPIVKAKRKAKRAAALAKVSGGKEEAEEEEAPSVEAKPESEARKKLEKLRQARKKKKEAAIAAGLPVEDSAEEAFEETMAEAEVEEEEAASPIAVKKRQKSRGKKADGQLLDFLKKKKEGASKSEQEGEAPSEEPGAETAGTEAEEAEGGLSALAKKKRAKKSKKNNGENGEEISAEEEGEAEAKTIEKTEEEETDSAASAPSLIGESKADETREDILALVKERKRKREERKRALLEEIQAESEPDELATIERKRKAKSDGQTAEEEQEDVPRNDRLEKLRKKRDELDQLERESEEEEKNGIALHTHQADELKGMNVWDTDENAAPDEGPAEKLLKKLKKDRKEKAASEKTEDSAEDEPGEFAEEGESSLASKARKKKSGAATQADGLEDAFAEKEETEAELNRRKNEAVAEEETVPGESRNDRLERLRKKRDQAKAEATPTAESEFSDEESPDPEKKSATEDETEEANPNKDAKKKEQPEIVALEAEKTEKTAAAHITAEEKLKKKSESSESMKRFLERRKQRKEAGSLDLPAITKGSDAAADAESAQKRSFLGIFVAISDSFGMASDKKMLNIFRAFETSLENCAVALTAASDGKAPLRVLFAASMEKGSGLPAEGCRLENFLAEDGRMVAHLALQMLATRTNFAEDESEAIVKAVRTLRPLVLQWLANASEKEKTAA